MASNELPELSVKISADINNVKKGINEARVIFSDLEKSISRSEKALLEYKTAAGAASRSIPSGQLPAVAREFRALDKGVASAASSLDDVSKASTKTKGSIGELRQSVASAEKAVLKYGAAAALAAGTAALFKTTTVAREFDILNAGLITATGSAKGAAVAFDAIKDFAETTPFSLQQATEGFTKLVNLGLTPSERAMASYGNTSSALGKDLNQMIEAVADAATGEFERLKEFGIKAKKEGDNVSLTFQGVTTQIGNNAAEIEGYLIGLGENQFAGAMEQRANSLDGAISNLEDTWNGLFLTVSQAGAGGLIEDSVRGATDAIGTLDDAVKSGELLASIKAIGKAFSNGGIDAIAFSKDGESAFSSVGFHAEKNLNKIKSFFLTLVPNVAAAVKLATVDLFSMFDKIKAFLDIELSFNSDKMAAEVLKFSEKIKVIDQAKLDTMDEILLKNQESVKGVNDELEAAKKLGDQYKKLQAEKAAALAGKDRLEEFKVGGDTGAGVSGGGGGGSDKEADKEAAARQVKLDALAESFEIENEMLQNKFNDQLIIIDQGLLDEQITRDQARALEMQATEAHEAAITAIQKREAAARLAVASGIFRNLSALMGSEHKKQFKIGKQAALAGATINGYEAIMAAFAAGSEINPYVGAAYAASAAVSVGTQINAIKSQQFGGGANTSQAAAAGGVVSPPQGGGGGGGNGQVTTLQSLDPSAIFSGASIIELINTAQENGSRLRFNP